MTISVESAGVLATILPIGLLIIGFEVRSVPSLLATSRTGTVFLWIGGALLVAALWLGFEAEKRLVMAVMTDTAIPAASSGWVVWGFSLVGDAAFLLLSLVLATKLGILQRIGRRANERVYGSERRRARLVRYVDKHHPGWRDATD